MSVETTTLEDHLKYLSKKHPTNTYTWSICYCEGEKDKKTGKHCTCQGFHVRVYVKKQNNEYACICNSSIIPTANPNEYVFQVETKRILVEWFI